MEEFLSCRGEKGASGWSDRSQGSVQMAERQEVPREGMEWGEVPGEDSLTC